MTPADRDPTRILVLSQHQGDAQLIQELLEPFFLHVVICDGSRPTAQALADAQPDVIVYAYEQHDTALTVRDEVQAQVAGLSQRFVRHILLCHKDDVAASFRLCIANRFHDYVHFWPISHDGWRLVMAAHNSARHIQDQTELARLLDAQRGVASLRASAQQWLDQGSALLQTARGHAQALAQRHPGPEALELQARLTELAQLRDPLQALALQAQQLGLSEAAPSGLPPCVMLIDDDPFQHKLLAAAVQKLGLRFAGCLNAQQVNERLALSPPDLILVDYAMPDMNGVDMLHLLSTHPRTKATPKLMLTGNSDRAVVAQSIQAGAVDYIVKPVTVDLLSKKLSRFIGHT